jgi:CRP/FNR family transcriptional regulator, cyclic AMP receptor protein
MLQMLARYPLFDDLSVADMKIIAPLFSMRQFAPETLIIRQDAPAECLFLLISGEVSVHYKPYDGPVITLTHVGAGGVFGWSALLNKPLYSASVTSDSACETLCICGKNLHKLASEHPQTGRVVWAVQKGTAPLRFKAGMIQLGHDKA